MPALDIQITPAVWGVCDGVTPQYISVHWDKLRSYVFRQEDMLYDKAMSACAFAHTQVRSRLLGQQVFHAVLIDTPSNGFVYTTELSGPIFDKYWYLSQKSEFWKGGSPVLGGQVSYPQALEIWEHIGQAEIASCRRRLEAWLELS